MRVFLRTVFEYDTNMNALLRVVDYNNELFANCVLNLDEFHLTNRDTARKYGWSKKGMRPIKRSFLVGGRSWSIVLTISIRGIQSFLISQLTGTQESHASYIEHYVAPSMGMHGVASENTILLMDNCSIHRDAVSKKCVEDKGAVIWWNARYRHDLAPIEKVIHIIKQHLRSQVNFNDEKLSAGQCERLISSSILSITPAQIRSCYIHCGIITD